MATTAYINIHTGASWQQGTILSSGIIMITPVGIIEFLLSYRIMGNGTLADKLHDVLGFVFFLANDLITDCAQSPDQLEWHFWYIWGSDGNNGFLLDFIAQPNQLELRLETYATGQTPTVLRQFLALSELSINGDSITMGPLTLTNSSCTGVMNGSVNVNVSFSLSARSNQFIQHMAKFIENIIPDPFSHYGVIDAESTVGEVVLASGVPLVMTTYSMNLGIDIWRWAMLSVTFVGSGGGTQPDLTIESIGFPTDVSGMYMGSSYVFYQGVEYKMDNTFVNNTWWLQTGQVNGDSRLFAVLLQNADFTMQVWCQAVVNEFAVLDSYTLSDIHTTVLGTCKVQIATPTNPGTSFTSDTALLEVKAFHGL